MAAFRNPEQQFSISTPGTPLRDAWGSVEQINSWEQFTREL
jgi:hypothetical protein